MASEKKDKKAAAGGNGGAKAAKPAAKPAAQAAKSVAAKSDGPRKLPRLQSRYREAVIKELMQEFGYKNPNQVPRLQKVVINVGLGKAVANPNLVPVTVDEVSAIAGQKAVATKSKKAIANFKLRAGLPIGVMVTLRRERMWEFCDRLFNVAYPRTRDFKGVSAKGFDGRGNYTVGMDEQTVFPEIRYEKVQQIQGMNISFITTAPTDKEGKALLKHLGMPFRN